MTHYKIADLNEKTPQARKDKLQQTLAEVAGVKQVKLSPNKGEASISCGSGQNEPKAEVIRTAVSKAGFKLLMPEHKA